MFKDSVIRRKSERGTHIFPLTFASEGNRQPALAQDAATKVTSSDLLFIVAVLSAVSGKKERAFLREGGF